MIVKIDPHPHGPKRLDEMRLIRKHQPGMIRIEDRLGSGINHPVPEASFQHPDDTPHTDLCAMLLA
jgi:hypothetical protein